MKTYLLSKVGVFACLFSGFVWFMGLQVSAVAQVLPTIPAAISPGSAVSPGPVLTGASCTLCWNWSSAGATYYTYRVAEVQSGWSEPVITGNTTTSSITIILNHGRSYMWSVAGGNSWGLSPYSSTLYFQTEPYYNITVSASLPSGGTVAGGGSFPSGYWRTVTATANAGYTFANWTEGETVVSASPTYNFLLTGDRTLVGNFLALQDIVIYSDTFVRSGALHGSQLGVATGFTGTGGYGGSGSASWTAAASITTDGSSTNGGAQKNAWLPFAPQAGHVYTYTLDLDTLGSGFQWAAMGFNVASQVEQESYGNATAWALQWQNAESTGIGICKGPGYTGETSFYPVGDGYNTLRWVLDTRNATWTAQFFINSVAQGAAFTYTVPPVITSIGFASSIGLTDGYSVRNLSLKVSPGDGVTDYASWAIANGVTGGPGGDSDHDGISNLMEYALNLNPSASDGSPGTLSGNLIVFAKRSLAVGNGDVSYVIEESDDLGLADTWDVVTPIANNDDTISYAFPSGRVRVFVRLKVFQN